MARGWPTPKNRDQQSSGLVVKSLAPILLAFCGSAFWAMQASAQEVEQNSESAADASLTEQQWRQRVEDARARSAEFVAKAKAGTAEDESSNEEEETGRSARY